MEKLLDIVRTQSKRKLAIFTLISCLNCILGAQSGRKVTKGGWRRWKEGILDLKEEMAPIFDYNCHLGCFTMRLPLFDDLCDNLGDFGSYNVQVLHLITISPLFFERSCVELLRAA